MKAFLLVIVVFGFFLLSCNPDKEICYKCDQASTGNYSNFCLPREDAKNKKEGLEAKGYDCSKFKQ